MNDKDNTSLGIIKPKDYKFIVRKKIEEIKIEKSKTSQKTLTGDKLIIPDEIEKAFSYKFNCNDEKCTGHDYICEDFE